MDASQENFEGGERSRFLRVLLVVFLVLLLAAGTGTIIYYMYQRSFNTELRKFILSSKDPVEDTLISAFLKYNKFYEKHPNITRVSFREICKPVCRDLPPAGTMQKSIRKQLRTELIPDKFSYTMNEYRILKMKEAREKFKLAKIGDTVVLQSVRFGRFKGVFHGFGSNKSSIRVNQKIFSIYDLERESKAQFDSMLNVIVQDEYVARECRRFKSEIEQFSKVYMDEEMKKQGYFFRGKYYSPSEYLDALKENQFSLQPEEPDPGKTSEADPPSVENKQTVSQPDKKQEKPASRFSLENLSSRFGSSKTSKKEKSESGRKKKKHSSKD